MLLRGQGLSQPGQASPHQARHPRCVNNRHGHRGVVGEMAYLAATPRSADIVITRDAEVLVLTKDMFRNTIKQEPSVASKVLLNLNLILSERLLATSAQLTAHTQGF